MRETTVKSTILIVATLDTKKFEAQFVREQVEHLGCEAIVMDVGILGDVEPDVAIDRLSVAKSGGANLPALVAAGDKGACIRTMIRGAETTAEKLFADGRFQGVIGIGGAQGTDIGTAAMRALPFGVPKFMVSTVACGQATFGPYVGTKDIVMMHSVADIQGLNPITRSVLSRAAAAIVAMVETGRRDVSSQMDRARSLAIGVSMLGTTTPGALRAKEMLERHGLEFVAFHQNGTGGIAMEEMIREGAFRAVLDLNLHEIGDRFFGGLHGAITDGRLETAAELGVPQVIAPGSINYTVQGPFATLPDEIKRRKHIVHNTNLTLVRLLPDEMREVGRITAEKINRCTGPVHVFIPRAGFCYPDREGGPLWEPEGNQAFIESLRAGLRADVPYDEIDAHINDSQFIDPAVAELLELAQLHKG